MQIAQKGVWGHEGNIRTWCPDTFQPEELQTETTLKNAQEEAFIKKKENLLFLVNSGNDAITAGSRTPSGPTFYSHCREGRVEEARMVPVIPGAPRGPSPAATWSLGTGGR